VPLRKEINLSDTDAYGSPWNFNDRDYAVLSTNQVNAFCLPGGYVVVFKGLLDVTGDRDDWLATVLGHEIAHAVAHHASERIARQQMYGEASDATAGLDRLKNDKKNDKWKMLDLLGVGWYAHHYVVDEEPESPHRDALLNQLQDLAFDRDQEEEADRIGVFLMAFADDDRYDPHQAVAFWEKMAALQQEAGDRRPPPEILSDHPSDEHRISLMKSWAVRAIDARNAWKAGRVTTRARP
jgi:predicted Zn-dependent protease